MSFERSIGPAAEPAPTPGLVGTDVAGPGGSTLEVGGVNSSPSCPPTELTDKFGPLTA